MKLAQSTRNQCYTQIVDSTRTTQTPTPSAAAAKRRNLRNVTITLEEDVAEWARIEAAKRDTSVSKLVGEMLREKRLQSDDYQAAYLLYLRMQDVPLPKILEGRGPVCTGREDAKDPYLLRR